jgi:type IV pilus assembly protein PilA
MRRQKGFSLIELLIVVGIILLIAAIAIPNMMRARISANEASAAAGARTLVLAQFQYQIAYPSIGYASTLAALGGSSCITPSSTSACLIDQELANSSVQPKDGYLYGSAGDKSKFSVGNYPAIVGVTGNSSFCGSEDGMLWIDPTGHNNSATCGPPPAQQALQH